MWPALTPPARVAASWEPRPLVASWDTRGEWQLMLRVRSDQQLLGFNKTVPGMGREKGHGGISASNVLGSGLMGNKGVVAGAAMDFFKGKR